MPAELRELTPLQRQLLLFREEAASSLSAFTRQAWPLIEPGAEYMHNWHIDCICEYLQAITLGQITRLIINMPPRYMKSSIVSVCWPVWEWIQNPSERWMIVSYGQNLADDLSRKRRTILESDWYRQNWPHVALALDQNEKGEMANTQQGVMLATSMSGKATGKGGNRVIFDDPLDPEQAASDVVRANCNTLIDTKFSMRLNDKRRGAIVLVQQRLHEDDPTGHLLAQGQYTLLCLEGVAEDHRVITFPLSGRIVAREPGELLWPQREGPEEIAKRRLELRAYGFAAQYQQRPAPEGGERFRKEWFRYFSENQECYVLHDPIRGERAIRKSECAYRFATADTAFTTKKASDFTAVGIWCMTPEQDLLLLHAIHQKMEDPEVEKLLRTINGRFGCLFTAVEKKNSGQTLLQRLNRDGIRIRELVADTDKLTRAQPAEIDFENGKIYFLKDALWLPELEAELQLFPNARHDDFVDMIAYAAMERGKALPVVTDFGEVTLVPWG